MGPFLSIEFGAASIACIRDDFGARRILAVARPRQANSWLRWITRQILAPPGMLRRFKPRPQPGNHS